MGHSAHKDVQGLELPSVSQIPGIFSEDLSGFEDWICRGLHDKASPCCTKAKRVFYQESADLGNDIHNLREAFLKGEAFSEGVPEYQAKVFDPVAAFYKNSGYKPLTLPDGSSGIELKMTGKEFGGTLDGCGTFQVPFWENQRKTFWQGGEFKDKPTTDSVWIEDLKIKSKLSIKHPLQLYGYALLLDECYGIKVKYGLIIRREKKLDKTPEIQLKGYYLPDYKKYWDASLLMWHFLND